jgi:hypothetical protein
MHSFMTQLQPSYKSFMGIKLLSYLIKLLYLMTLPSQQFCLCGTLFNLHNTPIKHAFETSLMTLRLVRHLDRYTYSRSIANTSD